MSVMSSFDVEDDNANIIIDNNNHNSCNYSDNFYSSGDSSRINSNNSLHGDSEEYKVKEIEMERNWSDLPVLAVENIYSFLSRTDQGRMSLTCSRWANEFSSPCLWKTMKFYLPEHDYSSEIYPEVRFARKYASMFRHVEIICKRIKTRLINVIWKQLKYFLQAMTSKSQLVSIKFLYLGDYFRRSDDYICEDLLKAIISFFNSQENLRTVVFEDIRFKKEEVMELLKSIFHSDGTKIRNFTLRYLVIVSPVLELSSQYASNLAEVCCRVAKVQSLEIDYSQIFEDIINCMHKNLSSGGYQLDRNNTGLANVNIYCEDKDDSDLRGILPGTWKYLTNVFPGLKVKMDISVRMRLNKMEKFLAIEIPLKSLDFRFERMSTSRVLISSLFTHLQICKYQNHLEDLNVLWSPPITDFAGSLIPFIQSCKNLQTFHLHVRYESSGIEIVLESFVESHPTSLKSVTVWFDFLREEDENNVKTLSDKYYPLFNAQSIQCFLIVDRRRRREPIQESENEM